MVVCLPYIRFASATVARDTTNFVVRYVSGHSASYTWLDRLWHAVIRESILVTIVRQLPPLVYSSIRRSHTPIESL